MKIINIKKFVRSILIILGLTIAIILLISKASYSNKEVEYKTLCVSTGDTLWSIAKSNQESNEYYRGKDVRYIINDIIRINEINGSNIITDQKLIIPVI